jgi:gas vesicle protein
MRRFALFGIGSLVGGVLGAFLAFLFTPDSGENLRQEARQSFEEMMDEARIAAEIRRQELERQLADLTTVKE